MQDAVVGMLCHTTESRWWIKSRMRKTEAICDSGLLRTSRMTSSWHCRRLDGRISLLSVADRPPPIVSMMRLGEDPCNMLQDYLRTVSSTVITTE